MKRLLGQPSRRAGDHLFLLVSHCTVIHIGAQLLTAVTPREGTGRRIRAWYGLLVRAQRTDRISSPIDHCSTALCSPPGVASDSSAIDLLHPSTPLSRLQPQQQCSPEREMNHRLRECDITFHINKSVYTLTAGSRNDKKYSIKSNIQRKCRRFQNKVSP